MSRTSHAVGRWVEVLNAARVRRDSTNNWRSMT
jgi:hypothetical protein